MIYTSIILLPGRIEGFKQLLRELPSYPIDFLYIHLCKYYPRLNTSFPTLELVELYKALDDFPVEYRILFHRDDIGPCLKIYGLLPELEGMANPDHYILLLDDDTIHQPVTIKQLCGSKPVKCIVGCMGVNAPHFIHGESIPQGTEVRVLGGYRGVLYPTETIQSLKASFKEYVEDIVRVYKSELDTIPLHDDHIFASFFRRNGIPLKVVPLTPPPNGSPSYRMIHNSNGIFQSESNHTQLALLQSFLIERGYEYN